MPWSILWTDQAVRDLSRIEPPIARRIVRKAESAADNPLRFFSRLVAADEYKLRVGDYRLLAALDSRSETILIARVDHRPRIYERREDVVVAIPIPGCRYQEAVASFLEF